MSDQLNVVRNMATLLGSESDAELIGALTDADDWAVSRAAEALGQRRVVAAAPALMEVLRAESHL